MGIPDSGRRRSKSELPHDCLLVLAIACRPLAVHLIRAVLNRASDKAIEQTLRPAAAARRVTRLASEEFCLDPSQVHPLLKNDSAALGPIFDDFADPAWC